MTNLRAPAGQGHVHTKFHGILAEVGSSTRKPDSYRAQDHYTITIQGLTPEKAAEYDGKYEAQTTRKQGAHSGTKKEDQDEPMDNNAQPGTAHHRRGVRPPQAREGGKGRVSKDIQ